MADGDVSTELGVVAFGLSVGAAGALAQLLAAERMERIEADTVPIGALILPMGAAAVAVIGASQMLPVEVE